MVNNGDIIASSILIHMQSGGNDCGLFAVAYATALAFGQDPGRCLFNQQQMRPHLHNCFLYGMLTPFPHEERKVARGIRIRNRDDITVHCHCRMPVLKDLAMIECSKCTQWYHIACEKESKAILDTSEAEWYCTLCQ